MRTGSAFLLAVSLAFAQDAQIAGFVSDPLGGRVAGAGVLLVQQETGIRRTTVTNERGIYAVAALRPGTYRIQVRKPGFQTIVRQDLTLEVSQRRRVDFDLPVGDMREIITVYGEPSTAGTAEGGVGILAPRKLVENLPINGRGLQSLLDIAPGTLTVPVRGSDVGQLSVNGQRSSSNYTTVDGVSANFGVSSSPADSLASGAVTSVSAIGSMHTVISLEALQEFRLVTSSAGAEYGRSAGAQIVLQSRSGGNQWRGSTFLSARNEAFDANDWFLNSLGQSKRPWRWWEGGGTIGGPIRKNRSFLFLSFDAFTLRQSQSTVSLSPSVGTRDSVPAPAKSLVDLYRLPNTGGAQAAIGQYIGSEQRRSSLASTSARWDHAFRPGLDAFVRYQRAPSRTLVDAAVLPRENAQRYGISEVVAGIGVTHTPHIQQEARLQFGTARFASANTLQSASAPDLSSFLPSFAWPQLDSIQITAGYLDPLAQGSLPARKQSQWNATDTLSILRGNHLLKAGVDWRRIRDGIDARGYAVNASYDSLTSLAARKPFLLAINRQEPFGLRFDQASAFVQDAWKVNERFSLSMGVRWEWYGAPRTVEGAAPFALDAGMNRLAPLGTPLWQGRGENFAPRLGFAWRLDHAGAWVLRGGAGLYFDAGSSGLLNVLIGQPPFGSTAATFFAFSGGIDPAAIVLPSSTARVPFATFSAYAPDFRPPHVWQGNVTVEHALAGRSVLAASWVASAGRDLARREAGPSTSADFTSLDTVTNGGASNYQALQAAFRQRALAGLEAMVSYTWSHSLDNGSRDTEVMLPGGRAIDWGNSAFDVRHSATVSFSYDPVRLRGWGIDGIVRSRSGLPVEMTSGLGAGGLDSAYRPDYVSGQSIWIADPHAAGGRALNPAAFAWPGSARQGSLGRNGIVGFGFTEFDAAIRREFRMSERGRLQVRAEGFNLANHPNFGNPAGAIALPAFGRSPGLLNTYFGSSALLGLPNIGASSGLVRDLQIGGPRVLQLQLRFRF